MNCALIQLDANGDCLNVTTLARQIKHDYPGCRLTWWISSRCQGILKANPHVDEVVVVDVADWTNASRELAWATAKKEVMRKQGGAAPYDRVWFPQVFPDNFRHFDGTVRPSLFRGYDQPITVPISPVVVLTSDEIARTEAFVERHRLRHRGNVVLFECSSNSSQSHVTPEYAKTVAELFQERDKDVLFLLSTMLPLGDDLPSNVVSAGELTMRENLALISYCSHFMGCGSGLSIVVTSDGAKRVPNIQILAKSSSVLGSYFHDFEYWGKPADFFVEMPDATPEEACNCLERCIVDGCSEAIEAFHRPIPVNFEFLHTILEMLVVRGQYLDAAESLAHTFKRYPDRGELSGFARQSILPLCPYDQAFRLPVGKKQWQFVQESFECNP